MLSTIIISAILSLIVVGAICSLIKGNRSGQCSCGCSHCASAEICHPKKQDPPLPSQVSSSK